MFEVRRQPDRAAWRNDPGAAICGQRDDAINGVEQLGLAVAVPWAGEAVLIMGDDGNVFSDADAKLQIRLILLRR